MLKKKATHRPVLIIQHAHHENPAIIQRALESQGIPTQVVHPYLDETYPSLDLFQGMISLGGPMGANDEFHYPWILKECDLLHRSVESGKPTVGICLGAQMMARALGGHVEKHRIAEVGWFPIKLNRDGLKDPLLGGAGTNPLVYHWHNDTFHLPKEALLLAASQNCERQAYRVGDRAYGFQFHPEADHQMVHEWMAVEGVDEEIATARKAYGTSTVQSSTTQKNRAAQGEKASLKITAGIAQLFSAREYESVACSFYEHLETWITHRTPVVAEWLKADGKPSRLRGTITMLFTLNEAEFVIFRQENTLLWPVRLDLIRAIKRSDER